MIGKLGKISPIKKVYSSEHRTLETSLSSLGRNRLPGTGLRVGPTREPSGEYRTGLNPDALYIKRMKSAEEQAQEKERVTKLKDELENLSGLDLGPRSDYYTKMTDAEYGTPTRARFVKLMDGTNLFNLDDIQDAITYAWLRVHENIAPSMQAFKEGRISARSEDIFFFVDDEEYQTEQTYKENTIIDKAVASLINLSPIKRAKIARLLGLKISSDAREDAVYNALTKYIKDTTTKDKLHNVNLFNKFIDMKDDNLEVQYLVEEALNLNIYRLNKYKVYEGENVIASTKQEVIEMLSTPKYQEDLLALKEKIKSKRTVEA